MKHNFKIRCSQIGKIMTNPRSKTETLSQTTKSYLEEWAKEQIYGRKKEITSKYFDKGNEVERDSIEFAISAGVLPIIAEKNESYFENDYLCGTPDVILPDEIIDMKNPWDCFSFPIFDHDLPTIDYDYQVTGYMDLLGVKKARVIYTLMNTPEHLISTWGLTDIEIEKVLNDARYDHIPTKYRIKEFSVYYDQEKIDSIYKRVEECREYLDKL